ncbi:MAG: hypothetical protein RL645_701 [Actinomycetota bacterium]|jgi:hypothetical protein
MSFGLKVSGYSVPVFNEREVRGAAGILFAAGLAAFMVAATTGQQRPLQAFAMAFMLDMSVRLFISPRYSPTLAIARLVVRKHKPEYVGAQQKKYAWGLGLGMAMISCFSLGLFGAPLALVLVMCSVCLVFLFLEAAFGICVGCHLQRLFSKVEPQYCPGGVCER